MASGGRRRRVRSPSIAVVHLSGSEFLAALASPSVRADLAAEVGTVLVVEDDGIPIEGNVGAVATLPSVVVLTSGTPPMPGLPTSGSRTAKGARYQSPMSALCDVVAGSDAELERIVAGVATAPLAATTLALLLRSGDGHTTAEGLVAESAAYSLLQAGPEFETWWGQRPPRTRPPTGPPTSVRRDGSLLDIIFSRPEVRNAYSSAMRDALVDALILAAEDPSIAEVHLRGEGPSFCSGGDLDEFGSRPDPATAHLVRLARNAGWLLDQISPRVTAHVHGPCRGSGIELAAFAGRVVAAADTTVALPEVAMGLIPGAGGTVSISRRIGRHRTALLALTGSVIDADTALEWGLLDAVD